jgi:phosphoribosyl 1,2-cyclic phosphodiesterase
MRVAGKRLIFDGGTGLRVLGQDLLQQELLEAHLFFTHSQWDRIQGFPFFYPAFVKGNCFHVYGATAQNGASIKQRLTDQMLRPNFEVPIHTMQSDLKFHDLVPGDTIALEDVTIETGPLNQPNRAIGYRVTWQGHCAVYATDTEPSVHRLDPNLLYLARQADLLIYDATYDELSPSSSKSLAIAGGHSTWQSGIEVAKAAGVKQVIMFHHDPAHNDDFLDQVEAQVQAAFPAGLLAREGMQLQIA